MSKTDDALTSQGTLLNKFSEIIRNLIKRAATAEANEAMAVTDRDNAKAQVAALLGADEATASAILADSPHIQSLIDEALAASPSTVTPDTLPIPN